MQLNKKKKKSFFLKIFYDKKYFKAEDYNCELITTKSLSMNI
jgi:hypothetical protein